MVGWAFASTSLPARTKTFHSARESQLMKNASIRAGRDRFGIGRWSALVAAGLASGALAATSLHAQNISRGTSTGNSVSGMFGQSSIGLQSGQTPGSNTGGFGSGMTTGQSGNAGNSMVQGGLQSQGSGMGLGGGMVQNTSGFIGSTSQNTSNFFSRQGQPGATQAGRLNFGTLGNLMTKSRQNQFNQQQAQRSTRGANQAKAQFRVPLRLGFAPTLAPARFNATVSQRLTRIPGLARVGSINATLEGQTAVLRGTVATEADRQLAEGLARLEPEVMAVRNELVVAEAAATGAAPPPVSATSAP